MTRRALLFLFLLATLVCGCTATPIHLPGTSDGLSPSGRRDLSLGLEAAAGPDAPGWKREAGSKVDAARADAASGDLCGPPPTDARGEGVASDGSTGEGKATDASAESKATLD